jgi:hypothetical protein
VPVTTVLPRERSLEVQAWLEHRRALGQDRFDEVWGGVYHVAPHPTSEHGQVVAELTAMLLPRAKERGLSFVTSANIGDGNDFRVPDSCVFRSPSSGAWHATAAVVMEAISPDDESLRKVEFYARHEVDEVLVAHPVQRTVRLWQRQASGGYVETGRSDVLDITATDIEAAIDWPRSTGRDAGRTL